MGVRRGACGRRFDEVVRAVAPTVLVVMSGRAGVSRGGARDGGVFKGRGVARRRRAAQPRVFGRVRCRTNVLQCDAEPFELPRWCAVVSASLAQLSLASGRRQRPTHGKKAATSKESHYLGRTRTKSATAFTAHLSWSQEYVPSARATTDARMTPIWPPDTYSLMTQVRGTMGGVSMSIHKVAQPGWQNECHTRDTSA